MMYRDRGYVKYAERYLRRARRKERRKKIPSRDESPINLLACGAASLAGANDFSGRPRVFASQIFYLSGGGGETSFSERPISMRDTRAQ